MLTQNSPDFVSGNFIIKVLEFHTHTCTIKAAISKGKLWFSSKRRGDGGMPFPLSWEFPKTHHFK
jgi:hypothetical protein